MLCSGVLKRNSTIYAITRRKRRRRRIRSISKRDRRRAKLKPPKLCDFSFIFSSVHTIMRFYATQIYVISERSNCGLTQYVCVCVCSSYGNESFLIIMLCSSQQLLQLLYSRIHRSMIKCMVSVGCNIRIHSNIRHLSHLKEWIY